MYPNNFQKFNIFHRSKNNLPQLTQEEQISSALFNIDKIKEIVKDYAYAVSVFRSTDPVLANYDLLLLKKLYPCYIQLNTHFWDVSPCPNYLHNVSFPEFPVQIMLETYLDLRDINTLYKLDPTVPTSQLCLVGNLNNEIQNVVSYKFNTSKKMKSEIVLERWIIEFKQIASSDLVIDGIINEEAYHLNELSKRLFDFLNTLPATALRNHLDQKEQSLLKVKFRVLNPLERNSSKGRFSLSKSFNFSSNAHNKINEHLSSECLEISSHSKCDISICVSYRKNCKFQLRSNGDTKDEMGEINNFELFELGGSAQFRRSSENSNDSIFSNDRHQYEDDDQKVCASALESPPPPYLIDNIHEKNNLKSKQNTSYALDIRKSDSNVSLAALLKARRESFAAENASNSNNSSMSARLTTKNNSNNNSVFISTKRNSVKDSLLESRGRYGPSFTNFNSGFSHTSKRNSGGITNDVIGIGGSRSNSFTNAFGSTSFAANSGSIPMDVDDYNTRSFIELLDSNFFCLKEHNNNVNNAVLNNCNNNNHNIGSESASSSGSSFVSSGYIGYDEIEDGLLKYQELRNINERFFKEINHCFSKNNSSNNIVSQDDNEYVLEKNRSLSTNAITKRPRTVYGNNNAYSNGNNNNYRLTGGMRSQSLSNPSMDIMSSNSGYQGKRSNMFPNGENLRERPSYTALRTVSQPSNIGEYDSSNMGIVAREFRSNIWSD